MTRQLVKSNTSTVWSPAWKYRMRWASVLPRFCSLVSPLSMSPAKGYKWLTHPTSAALQPSLTAFCKKRKCPGCIRDTQEKENMWPAGLWARGQPGLHGSFGTARDTQEYHVSKNWNQSHHHLPFSPCKWITSFCSLGMQGKDRNIELNGDAGELPCLESNFPAHLQKVSYLYPGQNIQIPFQFTH